MINVVIIGCGRIGKRHAQILSQHEVEGVRLAAVADVVPERAREYGIKYHVPYFTTSCNDSMAAAMMSVAGPHLITIATPSGKHAQHVRWLAKFGKPILVEKPLALLLQDVDTIGKLGVQVCEVKQNRYNLAVMRLKEAMLEGRLGRPRLANVRVLWSRKPDYFKDWHGEWAESGGVLANQAIHHVDLLWWLLGDVKQVSATATYSDYTEVETGLVATLEFESGCIGTIEATTLTRPHDLEGSLTICGETGTVELGGFAVNTIKTWEFETRKPVDSSIKRECENPPDVYGFGHITLYQDIARRLELGEGLPVTYDQSRKVLEIVHAIYESAETGQTVVIGNSYYPHSRLGK